MGDSTHDFMESFRNNVIPTLSKEDQTWRLHWYLVTLVQNNPERIGLDIDEIEKVFHDTCREPEEKKKFINSLRYLNFEPKESYRQLSQRIDAARKKTDKGECD
ncbi:hypothetical protein BGX31_006063 [Mortierella sp. GBA43]|nr:hypothetical protein BGX31_006063 [Mortierella sp. GBA43]